MDPFTLVAGIAGTAMSIFGMIKGQSAAKHAAAAQQQITGIQQQQEDLRRQAMELDADRRRRTMIRQAIIARSQALTTATSQGASKGSALGGTYGQIQGELAFGVEGVNQQEAIGEQMFNSNKQLLTAKQGLSTAESESKQAAGYQQLGGTIISNLGQINRLSGTYSQGAPGLFSSLPGMTGRASGGAGVTG